MSDDQPPAASLSAARSPPGRPGLPYAVQSLCGETIYIPCSKSAMRLIVTGKESENTFALVGTGGTAGDPIGFHYHRETHDVFLCLKGAVNVWAGDQCRTLGPGDLASVPPNTVHQYQILGAYTEFIGLIVPGGWEEFFRFIGEPYQGPFFPVTDDRNPFEVLLPKLKAATERFDMIPVRDHPQIAPQPWLEDKDNSLPGAAKPYYLRAGTGPRYLVGSVICSPLVTEAESAGRFSIACVEGSSWYAESSPLSETLRFSGVHHALQVADGMIELALEGDGTTRLLSGETVYVPRGCAFSLKLEARYTKVYLFASGGGLAELLCQMGRPYHDVVPPETSEDWQRSELEALQARLGFSLA